MSRRSSLLSGVRLAIIDFALNSTAGFGIREGVAEAMARRRT